MIIRISSYLEGFVRSLVQNGRYASEDEVVTDALRLLQNRQLQNVSQVSSAVTEQDFQHRLVEAGILAHAPAGYDFGDPYEDFEPVSITDEQISEMIIRESS